MTTPYPHLPEAPHRRRIPPPVHAVGLALACGALTVGFLFAVSDLVARIP